MHAKKTLIILVSLFIIFTGAQTVFAQKDYGLKETAEEAKLTTGGTVQGIIGNIIGAGLTMVGVLFLVLMIYGGIIWMTARGNEQQSKKALDTIIAAVIGLVIVLGSYALTNFVFTSVSEKSAAASCKFKILPPTSNCENTDCANSDENTCGGDCCEWK